MKLVPPRLGKRKRRVEPRFLVIGQPTYASVGGVWRLARIRLTIRNDADVPHRVDEAVVRYDDGRVGYSFPLKTQLTADIPSRETATFEVPASELLDPGTASRFWIVAYRGRSGRRLEWSSKAEPFIGSGPGGSPS